MADSVRNQTDKELAKMEKHLASIFAEAEKDLIKKAEDYLSKFQKLDEDKKSKVEEGTLTQAEYDEWRKNKLLYGEHWTRLISAVQNEMVNCNKTAIDYVNGKTAEIFAMNYNSIAEKIEESDVKGYSFEMVDAETVRQLATSGELMLPHKDLDEEKDKRWNAKQVNSQVLQGVLQGESIPKIAQRMANVCNNDKVAMVRTARTMITGAENSGRQAGMNKAADDGIIFWKMWIATSDERTRDSHNVLNGQVIPNDEKFLTINDEELEFPGDWRADGCEVYNCRCSLGSIIKGFNKKRLDEAIEEQQTEPEVEEHQEEVTQETNQEVEQSGKDDYENNVKDFVPAKTIQEAEEFFSEYVDDNQFGALGVSYKGINVEVANEINKTISGLFKTFNIGKFGGIQAPAGNTKLGKLSAGATAAYMPVRNSFLVSREAMKTLDIANKHFSTENKAVDDMIKHPEKYDFDKLSVRVRKVVEDSTESGRATVPNNIEEALMHEFGHALESLIKKHESWNDVLDNKSEFATKISGYANFNNSEYVAESFASYMKGENVADPKLIQIFEGLRRTNNG